MPLAGSTDGAVFNPATMEAFSSHGNGTMTIVKENSPTSFVIEQELPTMMGAKALTLDSKTNHVLTMAAEYAPLPRLRRVALRTVDPGASRVDAAADAA